MSQKRIQLPLFVLLTSLGFNMLATLYGQETEQSKSLVRVTDAKSGAGKSDETRFLRIRRDEDGKPLALQTAIVRYENKAKTMLIDLIGAVHIGEGDYYKQLNFQFDQYDALLYELVASEGSTVPVRGEKPTSTNPISLIQNSAQSMLGLESQLELINYEKKNFVHADLSPAEMQAKMAERGDNALTLGLSAVADMIRQQNLAKRKATQAGQTPAGPESLIEILGDPLKMKLMMAEQFASTGEAGLGDRLNQLLVTDRNEAAVKVLQKEIVNGKKKLGLFYGAAHMPDFEERLVNDFGMTKSELVWVDAWDLTQSKEPAENGASSLLMKLLEKLDR